MVVVRRTFLEVDEMDTNIVEFPRRERAFSDTILELHCSKTHSHFEDCDTGADSHSTCDGSFEGDSTSVASQRWSDDCDDVASQRWGDESEDEPCTPSQGIDTSSSVPCFCVVPVFVPVPTVGCIATSQVQEKFESRTTIMLRNLPTSFTRASVIDMLEGKGFTGQFDFVYLPVDFASGASLGYAFVNLINSDIATGALAALDGFDNWQGINSQKVVEVCWSDPHQGIDMLVDRFRNSRVMHGIVPDEYKPALFLGGVRAPFPKNTKRIRPPYSGKISGA